MVGRLQSNVYLETSQMEREFQAEVETLSRAQHPNFVLLQGYCTYRNDRLIIYSYMENGSLDYWLHEKPDGAPALDWNMRLQIAQGSARGLAYLHQSCNPHILHRDIKSSNILLDENFEAHLADFALAQLILPYDSHVTTDLVRTLGYIPPEYGQASVATYKGDVYSFGGVLLELLTGKRPMDMCRPKASRDFISWVIHMRRDKRESEVFDPFIFDKEHLKDMLSVLELACLCLNESPKSRPSTQQLVSWLDNICLKSWLQFFVGGELCSHGKSFTLQACSRDPVLVYFLYSYLHRWDGNDLTKATKQVFQIFSNLYSRLVYLFLSFKRIVASLKLSIVNIHHGTLDWVHSS